MIRSVLEKRQKEEGGASAGFVLQTRDDVK